MVLVIGKNSFLWLILRFTSYHLPNGSMSSESPNRVSEYSRKACQDFHAGLDGFGSAGHDRTDLHCEFPSRNCGRMDLPL